MERLSEPQRRQLQELAVIRDNGTTGEAYFYPTGSEFKTAHALTQKGYLRNAGHGMRVYQLTDEGYDAASRLPVQR